MKTHLHFSPGPKNLAVLVNITNLVRNLFLVYFINLYMFRATICPSSGETTVCMRHLVLVVLCGKLSGMQERMLQQSLHVSGDYVPIIRRNSCVYATLGTCYSVWMTVWCAGAYAPAHCQFCNPYKRRLFFFNTLLTVHLNIFIYLLI